MNQTNAKALELFITNFAAQNGLTVLEAIVVIRDHLNETLKLGGKS